MKEHPIIFGPEIIRAILDGRCTMTRRVIKPQPPETYNGFGRIAIKLDSSIQVLKCPYGLVGSRLWVRETHRFAPEFTEDIHRIWYKADGIEPKLSGGWRPSIFMPKKYARIWLEITEVRVERVQEIRKSNEHDKGSDIYAEGVDYMPPYAAGVFGYNIYTTFMMYWDSLNAKHGYGWDTNCWVWVIGFKLLSS